MPGRPGVISRVASEMLQKSRLPFVQRIILHGLPGAAREDEGFAKGISIVRGQLTDEQVAKDFGMQYVPLESAFAYNQEVKGPGGPTLPCLAALPLALVSSGDLSQLWHSVLGSPLAYIVFVVVAVFLALRLADTLGKPEKDAPSLAVEKSKVDKDRILAEFKKGKISWPRTTLEAKRHMVGLLAKSLDKPEGSLTTADFRKPQKVFGGKRLYGLLYHYKVQTKERTLVAGLNLLMERLGIEKIQKTKPDTKLAKLRLKPNGTFRAYNHIVSLPQEIIQLYGLSNRQADVLLRKTEINNQETYLIEKITFPAVSLGKRHLPQLDIEVIRNQDVILRLNIKIKGREPLVLSLIHI
mgnify:CR=1 FL=1